MCPTREMGAKDFCVSSTSEVPICPELVSKILKSRVANPRKTHLNVSRQRVPILPKRRVRRKSRDPSRQNTIRLIGRPIFYSKVRYFILIWLFMRKYWACGTCRGLGIGRFASRRMSSRRSSTRGISSIFSSDFVFSQDCFLKILFIQRFLCVPHCNPHSKTYKQRHASPPGTHPKHPVRGGVETRDDSDRQQGQQYIQFLGFSNLSNFLIKSWWNNWSAFLFL